MNAAHHLSQRNRSFFIPVTHFSGDKVHPNHLHLHSISLMKINFGSCVTLLDLGYQQLARAKYILSP